MKKLIIILLLSLGFIGVASAGEVATNVSKLKALNACVDCNLQGANLNNGADFEFADLRGANLSGVNFYGGFKENAAILNHANFRKADLSGADLRWTKLNYANFRGADLSGADLRGAKLKGADFEGATLCNTKTPWGIDNSGC
jgi:uncharacterized protein YjbI with pentapeptide repeats